MRTSLFVLPAFLIAGCAATQLHDGAERVMVTHMQPPPGCIFVGTIVGEQGGALTGRWTSNRNLAEGAMNDVKNKALELHANYVLLETTSEGNTVSGNKNGISGEQTDVTHVGNAFRCTEATPDVRSPEPPQAGQ